MPRPHWPGMRPNRSWPTGVMYSPHTRWPLIEFWSELTPAVGGPCVVLKKPVGAYGLYPADWYAGVLTPFVVVEGAGWIAYASGVEPRTTLSSAKISLTIRRLSEMWISGSSRRRMFAVASLSS